MALTAAHLRDALQAVGAPTSPDRLVRDLDTLAQGARDALTRAPSDLTKEGVCAWLATLMQESAYLRTTTEYGSGQRYAPYVGRTFEQITWRANYAAFGVWCKARGLVDDAAQFVEHPKTLSNYEYAWLGGVWYFEHADLWRYANRGDFLAVSQGVNGGTGRIGTTWKPNGWAERKRMYDVLLAVADEITDETDEKRWERERSGDIAVDGILGTGSTKALQRLAGTTADGVISGQPRTIRGTHGTHGTTWDRCWPTIDYGRGGSTVVAWLQRRAGVTDDGILGPVTVGAVQTMVGVKADRIPGTSTVRALQAWINNGGTMPATSALPTQTGGMSPLDVTNKDLGFSAYGRMAADASLLVAFEDRVKQLFDDVYFLEDNRFERLDWHLNHVRRGYSAHQFTQPLKWVDTYDNPREGMAFAVDVNFKTDEARKMRRAVKAAVAHGLRANIESTHLHVDCLGQRLSGWHLPRTIGVPTRDKVCAADGILGPATALALQHRVGATPDGDWGPKSTKALQRRLNSKHGADLEVDGLLGPATEAAIRKVLRTKKPLTVRYGAGLLQQAINVRAI